jgi:hypothetical protein
MAKRNDDDNLKDSFYLYIMRNSIGAGLKTQYAPNGRLPDRLAALLHKLDTTTAPQAPAEAKESEKRRSVRKR